MRIPVTALLASLASCAGSEPAIRAEVPGRSEAAPPGEPRAGEVPLPAEPGWEARLVLDVGATGVWTVGALPVFPQYATPEVVGLDDLGRAWVCVSYSGKWTPIETVHDGKWLGGLAHGDVDPRVGGAELYVGGQAGNLHQVVAHPEGMLDHRRIAHLAGREIHTVLAGELDGAQGAELLVFTRPGALFRVSPTAPHGTFETELVLELEGRVRDALVLPDGGGFVTASRAGRLEHWRAAADGFERRLVHAEPMGMGRVALRPVRAGEPLVLYTALDDGRVLRHERGGGDAWTTTTIHAGAQGLRGLAAGRFTDDPDAECVAIFGYSAVVELLTREADGWRAEPVFRDRDRGHWLAAAELDGRNGTLELLASGYGGRVVLLSRPVGYGSE